MSLDAATVRRIAKLARIRLSEGEVETLGEELGTIIAWVEQLREVDVEGVEPMTGPIKRSQRLRDDRVTEPDRHDALLANAPDRRGDFFTVPKVVE